MLCLIHIKYSFFVNVRKKCICNSTDFKCKEEKSSLIGPRYLQTLNVKVSDSEMVDICMFKMVHIYMLKWHILITEKCLNELHSKITHLNLTGAGNRAQTQPETWYFVRTCRGAEVYLVHLSVVSKSKFCMSLSSCSVILYVLLLPCMLSWKSLFC